MKSKSYQFSCLNPNELWALRHSTCVGMIMLVGTERCLTHVLLSSCESQLPPTLLYIKERETPVLSAARIGIDACLTGDPSRRWIEDIRGREAILIIDGCEIRLDIGSYTERECAVYKELINVRRGETVSYAELARRADIPKAGRFVGNAMAKNRFPILIPCHRVICSDGTLGGFSGGMEVKQRLLLMERP